MSKKYTYILRKQNIRLILKQKGLKQSEVSEAVWGNKSTFGSKLNLGYRIDYEHAKKLADFLGVDLKEVAREIGLCHPEVYNR